MQNRRGIKEILSLESSDRQRYYAAQIKYVKIDNNVFENYGAYSFIYEKSYVDEESTKRSIGGVVDNLNNAATFVTPHLKIDFSLLSIDDYILLMQLDYATNEHIVECYDIVSKQIVIEKMYLATPEMPKLYTIAEKRASGEDVWEEWISLVGVQDYTVELIGTNADVDLLSVVYHLNPPIGNDRTIGSESTYKGGELIISVDDDSWKQDYDGYIFKYWNTKTDGSGVVYSDGYAKTINNHLVLYAIWENLENYTLTYDYGIQGKKNTSPESKQVEINGTIGALPEEEVQYLYKEYELTRGEERQMVQNACYWLAGWYKTPQRTSTSERLTKDTVYWTNHSSTIYRLFEPYIFSVNFQADTPLSSYSPMSVAYNTKFAVSNPTKTGYNFVKWQVYYNGWFLKDFDGIMPALNITLVAVWEKV